MGKEISLGQEVFLEDGRRAVFAGEINGQKLVRLFLETDEGEYVADTLTPAGRLFVSEPVPSIGPQALRMEKRIADLREDENAVRASVLKLRQEEAALQKAVGKFPDLQLAIDFLEGRITHVVVDGWGGAEILPLEEALAYEDRVGRFRCDTGLKLLCLFGFQKGEKPQWAINRYYDGSGPYTTIDPFKSEAEARAEIQRRADAEIAGWRSTGKGDPKKYEKAGASLPQDYLDHEVAKKEAARMGKIAKLRADIAALEASQ